MDSNCWTKASEKMPTEPGEYLVVIKSEVHPYLELCDFYKKFSCWDYYNDSMRVYKQKEVLYWMKVPEYENLPE